MIVIGLTGSIGMGKTTVAAFCARLGIAVNNADAVVHRALHQGGAGFAAVAREFPEALHNGAIDRAKLGAIVFADPKRLDVLENILHPLVARDREKFLARARRQGREIVVLDIPLLFEKKRDGVVDVIITVSAPGFVQRARVLARRGMTVDKYEAIRHRQMGDAEKRRRSDYVIRTGGSRGATLKQLQRILKRLESSRARNRPRYRNHRPRSARRP